MAEQFKLIVTISGHESGQPVHFKQDGQRFDQAHTVKLNTNTDYDIKFTLKPGRHIDKLMINGELHRMTTNRDKQTEDEFSRTFTTQFTTQGYDLSKSGNRKEILIVIELENGVYIKLGLQCKMYQTGETSHAQWGQRLTALDLDCKLEQGHNYVTILKEKYL